MSGAPAAGAAAQRIPRVLFVASHAKLGGSEAYLETLLERLGEPWSAGVVALEDGPAVGRLRARGHHIEVVPTGRRLGILAGAAGLSRVIRRQRPDVVHANGVKAALVAVLASARTPVVWVKHDFFWDGALATLIARRARLIVAVSAAVGAAVAGPRTRVVHNGVARPEVDRERGQAAVRVLAGGGPVVGLVGRIEPVKGQAHLIDALAAVRAMDIGARALIVGTEDPSFPGHLDALRARAARLGLSDAVVFAGRREDAVELMAGCSLVAVPTVADDRGMGREGFGLVGVEALAVGTPVVGYADGALPEILGDCAALVAPGDVRALAEAIARLLGDAAERERLAACGIRRAERYTIDGMVEGMRAAYREAAPRPVRRRRRRTVTARRSGA